MGDFYYRLKLNGTNGIDLGTTNFVAGPDDDIPIYFFGQEYKLVEANLSTGYLKLQKVS